MTPDAARYVISDAVLSSHLEGETVLLELEEKRYFRLNETGSEIWRALEEETPKDAIVERLVERYEVDPDEAERAVDQHLTKLGALGLVREAP